MTEPTPTYTTQGETLDPGTVETLARYYESMWSDGISIVRTAERGLRSINRPVPSALRSKGARQSEGRDE